MPINDGSYAQRMPCRDHSRIYTGEKRGSLRGCFFSDCEGKRMNYGCKFSHTIFNTKRVLKLGGESQNFVISLDYGYGFERYGAYEGWASGWGVTVNGKHLWSTSNFEKTYNLSKALLLAEHRLGMSMTDVPKHDKVQSLCRAHYERSSCRFGAADCRCDHDLIDARRIENFGRWSEKGTTPDLDILSVECRVTGGRAMWKITLKQDAFAKLDRTSPVARAIPPRPFSYEDEDLLAVVRRIEGIVGASTQLGSSSEGSSSVRKK